MWKPVKPFDNTIQYTVRNVSEKIKKKNSKEVSADYKPILKEHLNSI